MSYEDLSRSIEDSNADMNVKLLQVYQKEIIQHCLDKLSPREKRVIRLRYGFSEDNYSIENISSSRYSRTLEEVGCIFGVTRNRIRQIENKYLRKVKNMLIKNFHYLDEDIFHRSKYL